MTEPLAHAGQCNAGTIARASPESYKRRMVSVLLHPPQRKIIPRQWTGYWGSPWDPELTSPPLYSPTGAVLPRLGANLHHSFLALTLVAVEDCWSPLSTAGMHAWAHTNGLLRMERWRLLVWPDAQHQPAPWSSAAAPWVFEAAVDAPVLHAEVEELYGQDAAMRSRADRPVAQLRLQARSQQ